MLDDGSWFALIKAGPAAAGVELLLARKEALSTSATTEDAVGVDIEQRAGKRCFSGRLAQHRVSLWRKFLAPLVVGLINVVRHESNLAVVNRAIDN